MRRSCASYSDAEVPIPHRGDRCPRAVFYRVLTYAMREHDVSFLVGFELEVCLFGNLEDGTPFPQESHTGHYAAAGIRTAKFPWIEECIEDLLAAGIDVLHFHAEGARGGYEIATGPLAPLQAIDALVLSQETIKNCLARHGHQVTFHPNRLPNDLKEALALLREHCGGIDLLMGAGIISGYLAIKEAEEAIMKELSPEKRSALYCI